MADLAVSEFVMPKLAMAEVLRQTWPCSRVQMPEFDSYPPLLFSSGQAADLAECPELGRWHPENHPGVEHQEVSRAEVLDGEERNDRSKTT